MPCKPSFLIDINGVLYTCGRPVDGAAETVDFLRDNGYSFRFVSNATRACRGTLRKRLECLGFRIAEEELFTAPIATARYVMKTGLKRCFLLTAGDVRRDFIKEGVVLTGEKPDHVVVGDAGGWLHV